MTNVAGIETSVAQALDRAEIVKAERDTSGGDTGYVARIALSNDDPVTAGELEGVLRALRKSTPADTAYYGVIFSTGAGDGASPVDGKAAAEELGIRTVGFFTGFMVSSSQVDKAL